MLKQVTLAKFVSVNKEAETSTFINNEATEEHDEVYVFIMPSFYWYMNIAQYSFRVIFKTYACSYNYCYK